MILTQRIVMSADNFEQVLGFRYMLGEMEALKSSVNQGLVEQTQLAALYGEPENGGDSSGSGSEQLDNEWC